MSQASVDKAVLNFIVQGLHPPHIVQQQGFIDLVKHLQPNTNVMTRNTVVNKVTKASVEIKRKLNPALSDFQFIATTTDCWTAHRRSFIGVTAHWFNPQSMQRSCAAWHASNLEGHTFSALAVNDIHTEFNIRENVRTTTDNGSNFLKAFRVYGQTDETTILNLQERVTEKRMMVAKMRITMKKRKVVRVLNLLMLEPCWRKMTTWNTSYPSTIAAPATSSIKCPQSMLQKQR